MTGGLPEPWGKLPEGTVQVLPTEVSVHSVMTVLPAASLEIFAPLIGFAPAASLATVIVVLEKALRATFRWVLS